MNFWVDWGETNKTQSHRWCCLPLDSFLLLYPGQLSVSASVLVPKVPQPSHVSHTVAGFWIPPKFRAGCHSVVISFQAPHPFQGEKLSRCWCGQVRYRHARGVSQSALESMWTAGEVGPVSRCRLYVVLAQPLEPGLFV
jgi:hypothetical protein